MTVDVCAIVQAMYAAEIAKDFDRWSELFDDDVVVTFPLSRQPETMRVDGKAAWAAITRQKFIDRARTDLSLETMAFADGRRVFNRLRVSIDFEDGRNLRDLPLAMVLTVNDAGAIVSVEEYVNEAYFEG